MYKIFIFIISLLVISKISFAYDIDALLKRDSDTDKHPKQGKTTSLGFGVMLKQYHWCKTWSDVKFSPDQIKKDIRKISKADASNFSKGFNRYSRFRSCKYYKSQQNYKISLDEYFNNLRTASDEKIGTNLSKENTFINNSYDYSVFQDSKICALSVIKDGSGNKQWSDKWSDRSGQYRFVEEAKRRGLNCGVKVNVNDNIQLNADNTDIKDQDKVVEKIEEKIKEEVTENQLAQKELLDLEKLENESQTMIADIKEFSKGNKSINGIELAKLFLKFNKSISSPWSEQTAKNYSEILAFMQTVDGFNQYVLDKKAQTERESENRINEIVTVLSDYNNILQTFLIENLGSEKTATVIELSEKIIRLSQDKTLNELTNLQIEVKQWLTENDLLEIDNLENNKVAETSDVNSNNANIQKEVNLLANKLLENLNIQQVNNNQSNSPQESNPTEQIAQNNSNNKISNNKDLISVCENIEMNGEPEIYGISQVSSSSEKLGDEYDKRPVFSTNFEKLNNKTWSQAFVMEIELVSQRCKETDTPINENQLNITKNNLKELFGSEYENFISAFRVSKNYNKMKNTIIESYQCRLKYGKTGLIWDQADNYNDACKAYNKNNAFDLLEYPLKTWKEAAKVVSLRNKSIEKNAKIELAKSSRETSKKFGFSFNMTKSDTLALGCDELGWCQDDLRVYFDKDSGFVEIITKKVENEHTETGMLKYLNNLSTKYELIIKPTNEEIEKFAFGKVSDFWAKQPEIRYFFKNNETNQPKYIGLETSTVYLPNHGFKVSIEVKYYSIEHFEKTILAKREEKKKKMDDL